MFCEVCKAAEEPLVTVYMLLIISNLHPSLLGKNHAFGAIQTQLHTVGFKLHLTWTIGHEWAHLSFCHCKQWDVGMFHLFIDLFIWTGAGW